MQERVLPVGHSALVLGVAAFDDSKEVFIKPSEDTGLLHSLDCYRRLALLIKID